MMTTEYLIELADGRTLKLDKKAPLQMELPQQPGKTLLIQAFIMPELSMPLNLGMDFLIMTKEKINFEYETIEIKRRKIYLFHPKKGLKRKSR